MKRFLCVCVALFGLLFLSAPAAWADPIRVRFGGVVKDCHLCLAEWKVKVGTKMRGVYTYDSDAVDVVNGDPPFYSFPSHPDIGVYRSPYPMTIKVGKLRFTASSHTVVVQNNGAEIPNEAYWVSSGGAGGIGSPVTEDGLPIAGFGFTLAGSLKDLFKSDALVKPPKVEDFAIAGLGLSVVTSYAEPPESHTWAQISGNLTKLQAKGKVKQEPIPVPEPAPWLLLVVGCAVAARYRRRY